MNEPTSANSKLEERSESLLTAQEHSSGTDLSALSGQQHQQVDEEHDTGVSLQALLQRRNRGFNSGAGLRAPIRVESDMVLDDLADGIQCQSPVGLMATHIHNQKAGVSFRVKSIRRYITGPLIGEGAYGKVKLAIDTATEPGMDQTVALKIISKRTLRKQRGGDEKIKKEVEMMRLISEGLHPNIMNMLDEFENDLKGKVYIVFPLAVGSLQAVIDNSTLGCKLSSARRYSFLSQLLSGLSYLHSIKVVHKDLKPSNCMLMGDMRVLISDFGTAEHITHGTRCKVSDSTPAYQPPEIAEGAIYYNAYKADVWSMGVTMYQLLALRLPFEGINLWKTYEAIINEEIEFSVADQGDRRLRGLLEAMLDKNAKKRWRCKRLALHPFVTGVDEIPEDSEGEEDEGEEAGIELVDRKDEKRPSIAGLTVDWRSGRAMEGEEGEDDEQGGCEDATGLMLGSMRNLHALFSVSLSKALMSSLIHRDPAVLDYINEHTDNSFNASPAASPPQSPLKSPMLSPTLSSAAVAASSFRASFDHYFTSNSFATSKQLSLDSPRDLTSPRSLTSPLLLSPRDLTSPTAAVDMVAFPPVTPDTRPEEAPVVPHLEAVVTSSSTSTAARVHGMITTWCSSCVIA